jgi:hypothetical protein
MKPGALLSGGQLFITKPVCYLPAETLALCKARINSSCRHKNPLIYYPLQYPVLGIFLFRENLGSIKKYT